MEKSTVGYIRVSSQGQISKGDGLGIQRKKIVEYCKQNEWGLEEIYEDRGISGTIKNRSGLLSLLKECELKGIKRVVIYKYDRLSREMAVSLWIETQFRKNDVEIISVLEPPFDLQDPLQKAFKRIVDVFAELEKDTISVRLQDGRINNVKNGKRGAGSAPFGFDQEKGTLTINNEEAQWVEKMYRCRARGFSLKKIVDLLNKHEVKTKRDKVFHSEAVRYILSNSLYYGETSFGNMKVTGNHTPIISKRLFMKAERRYGSNCFTALFCDAEMKK